MWTQCRPLHSTKPQPHLERRRSPDPLWPIRSSRTCSRRRTRSRSRMQRSAADSSYRFDGQALLILTLGFSVCVASAAHLPASVEQSRRKIRRTESRVPEGDHVSRRTGCDEPEAIPLRLPVGDADSCSVTCCRRRWLAGAPGAGKGAMTPIIKVGSRSHHSASPSRPTLPTCFLTAVPAAACQCCRNTAASPLLRSKWALC